MIMFAPPTSSLPKETNSRPAVSGERIVSLDVLRGLAILLVMFHHDVIPVDESGLLTPVASTLKRFGYSGVDLFFVLSGFLIGTLLFKEIRLTGRLHVRRFLLRRLLKIWPAYFFFLGFGYIKLYWHEHSFATAFRLIEPNLLHLQNYLGTSFGPTWSLAVEEHFYLALPLLLAAICMLPWPPSRSLRLAVPCIVAMLLLGCGIARLNLARFGAWNFGRQMTPTHLRIDSLSVGVAIAYLSQFHPEKASLVGRSKWTFAVGIAFLSPMFFFDNSVAFVHTIGLTMLAMGYACLLLYAVEMGQQDGWFGRLIRTRLSKAIAWVGVYSYAIYLWHMDAACQPVQHWLRPLYNHLPPTPRYVAFVITYLVVAFFVGYIMTRLVEWPALILRERWVPARLQSSHQREGRDILAAPIAPLGNQVQVSTYIIEDMTESAVGQTIADRQF